MCTKAILLSSLLGEDAVEAELKLMLEEGLLYTLPERSRRNYTVMLNVLHVKWERWPPAGC